MLIVANMLVVSGCPVHYLLVYGSWICLNNTCSDFNTDPRQPLRSIPNYGGAQLWKTSIT